MNLASLSEALAWLREARDGLEVAPMRLHQSTGSDGTPESITGIHDGLGGLPFSRDFIALLDGSPFRTRTATETVVCPNPHPVRGPECALCRGQLSWTASRTVYVAPLAAALERLSHVKSPAPTVPSPFVLCVALLDCGLDIDRMHERLWGKPISSEDRRKTVEAMVISALRKLHGRWSSGPIPKRSWVDLSESQQRAQDAA